MWTLPVTSIAVYAVLYALAGKISHKTKGILSTMLLLSLIYLAGFLAGVFPKDAFTATGIPTMIGSFGTLCIVTNLGTLINAKQFVREWRTVVICLGGLVGLAAFCLGVGNLLFDRIYSLCAIPAISGGIVALLIMKDALVSSASQYIAFTMLLFAIHGFIGLPAASVMLRKYCLTDPSGRAFLDPAHGANKESRLRIFHFKEDGPTEGLFARLTVVMAVASLLALLTNNVVPAAIFGIILGVVATEMGFLAGNTLEKCGFYGLMMFFMVSSALDPLAQVDLTSLLAGLWPLFFYMIGGCAATMIGGMLTGKLLKVDWRLACALSCGCMLGFPSTLIAAEYVVDSFGFPE